jgi:hypothetical protein
MENLLTCILPMLQKCSTSNLSISNLILQHFEQYIKEQSEQQNEN